MISIKDVDFDVEITRKHIKNIYLKIDGNLINVTCPYYVPKYEVYKFIEEKKNWIYKAYIFNNSRPKNKYMYRGGDVFYIFGEEYIFNRNIGKKNFDINDNTLSFSYKDDSLDGLKALYKMLDKTLLSKANEYLDKYSYLLKDYGYNLKPELKARIMTSKWGVCYTRNNSITLNSYLIHYPYTCLEYIVLHEITHFIIPNHSKRFYEIIGNNMPNYKEIDNLLK